MATSVIRETERYQFFESSLMGCTAIQDRHTGSQTNWNTGEDAQEEKDHLLNLDSNEFDHYCEVMLDKD